MEHLRITVDGKAYDVVVEKIDSAGASSSPAPSPVRPAAPVASTPAPSAPAPAPKAAAEGDMVSPLAGIVQAIAVQVGTQVNEGDLVITLEAMKMYTPVNATASGTIKAIHVKTGDAVEEGQPLFTIG
ncbi:MAG TPA: biotin/lipoyl-containing protein [Luteolibacter sp.]|nr:biotin/lipoyl-containing protein [Luteolibacter sp.]